MSFSNLGLSPEVLKAIEDAGYVEPTPIQQEAIPYVLMTRDVLGCAQTGTGKTASFTLPMIDILSSGRAKARMPRSLILTPTRELATQIAENFEIYGKYNKLTMALLIGGVSMEEQTKKLDRGVDVLIATPGRLLDHFERGRILLNDIKVLVIDEADRMLDMGFIPDVEKIVSRLPKIRQTLFFSATMPPEIRRLSDAFLMNPKEVTVAPQSRPAAETVTQMLTVINPREKREALRRIIKQEHVETAIIFCNRKRDVDILDKSLRKHGFNAAGLHGDMDQASRSETLERFKDRKINFLVASDVAARGIDIDDLPVVFNFDVPLHSEDYIHRIGRTGRAGREGRAFSLASPADGVLLQAIESLLGNPIQRLEIEGLNTQPLEQIDDKSSNRTRRRAGRSRNQKKATGKVQSGRKQEQNGPNSRNPGKSRRVHSSDDKNPNEGERKSPWRDEERPRRRRKRSRGENDKDPENAVVGMGDHMPDFLKKPARPQ
ncbi:MAG: DEAD/DEAH box helicase [Pseudomonadota bacterium]|nr:DEAD/DEAH box helicase [Pseudomonadota bacterium]